MKLQLFMLCCILQSIYGLYFNASDFIMYPPDMRSTRIVGGEDAPDGAAPFQCSMQLGKRHFCGCSIISNQWILTASHCVAGQNPGNVEIMVGTNVLNEGGTYYKTDRYVMHESYNRPNFANDIAVLKVQGEIEFNDKVQPIDLLADEVPDGTELQLTGWGTLVAGGSVPKKLQIIKLKAVSTQRCREIYGGGNVHDSHICTFNKAGEGACHGDSGGPLVLGNAVVGVVNWGVPCAIGYPDAFAKVSYLYNWVKRNAV